MLDDHDTIFAVASGSGFAAVSVVRLSGPSSGKMLAALCPIPPQRRASLRRLRHEGETLDQALVLWLPGPGSYTGEDCVELHLHGGPAVRAAVTGALVDLGARPAEPGEFTRRAFLAGRMDLTEAEAVADLIQAETAAQRRQALAQLDGAVAKLFEGWRQQTLRLLAHQEALIEFPTEDLPEGTEAAVAEGIVGLRAALAPHLRGRGDGERLRDGLVVAVIGPPNAGKSTLVNALTGRDVAITSAVPGTTRDVLEARLILRGVPVTLLDTAGLRATDNPVEAEGIRRARVRAAQADLVLNVSDGVNEIAALLELPSAVEVWQIAAKADVRTLVPAGSHAVSAVTGTGLEALRARLEAFAERVGAAASEPSLTRARHRAALRDADAFLAAAQTAELPELRGNDLRAALRCLGRVTGWTDTEAVLDAVFRDFCIGK